jgi:heme-degrading monooxygenase HmoA
MRQQPGFISNRLHRATTPDARFRFINYVQWESEEHWRAAHDDGFRRLLARPEWRDFAPPSGAIFEIEQEYTAPRSRAA